MLVDGKLVEPGIEGTGLVMLAGSDGASRTAVQVAQPDLLLDVRGTDRPDPSMQAQPAAPAVEAAAPEAQAAPAIARPEPGNDGDATAAPESSSAVALPPDLVAGLSTAHAQILERLVRRWREGPAADAGMHRCPDGAAVEVRLLAGLCPDATAFLARLSELGLLYAAPSTSGRLVYPLPRGGRVGGRARTGPDCFILAPHAMQRLGMS
jgi:hypothetical protein